MKSQFDSDGKIYVGKIRRIRNEFIFIGKIWTVSDVPDDRAYNRNTGSRSYRQEREALDRGINERESTRD